MPAWTHDEGKRPPEGLKSRGGLLGPHWPGVWRARRGQADVGLPKDSEGKHRARVLQGQEGGTLM